MGGGREGGWWGGGRGEDRERKAKWRDVHMNMYM